MAKYSAIFLKHNIAIYSATFSRLNKFRFSRLVDFSNIKTLETKETQTKKFSSLREKLVDGPDLQISRFYDILQLCFCLWGYLKSKVYCPRPNNLNELQAKISNEVAQIDPAMVRRAVMDMKARAVKCIAAGGGHFEK